ncbi:MAG TPA: 4'-phosphopantetheinyl transferase superfamily protein [Myxococcaceae bacterium]|nr:4'-phosphopantetheinyl transferase superfamily protein [Myxococcaceae bacterium]
MPLTSLLLEPPNPRVRQVVVPPLGMVCVAWVDLTRPVSSHLLARLRNRLTPDEQARADRFRFDADRNAFVIGRSLMRGALGRLLHRPAAEVPLVMGPHGRPELVEGMLPRAPSFNVSHTREMLGFALSHSTVGLDVEAFRRDPDPMTVGAQVFSARELARLGTLSGEAQRELFRRLWTLKEAYLKARGTGFSLPAREVTCELEPGQPPRLSFTERVHDAPERWHCAELRPNPRTWAAVCAELPSGLSLDVEEVWSVVPED